MFSEGGRRIEERLSLVVTVYNVAPYLKECLDSILSQTVLPGKVILVDDGSNDGSGAICDHYGEENDMFCVLHQSNSGVSVARTVGLKKARTEYVLYVDGDDYLRTDLIQMLVPYIDRDIDIIHFGITRYYSAEYQRQDIPRFAEGVYFRDEIKDKIIPKMLFDAERNTFGLDPSLCTKVLKRALYGNYVEKVAELQIHYAEDVGVCYFPILDATSFAVISDCLYYHRQRQPNVFPSYLTDEAFIDKLHRLYDYMKDHFQNDRTLIEQLERFYLYSFVQRMRIYGFLRTSHQCIFPFNLVEKNKIVALYGAGSVGQTYFRQISAVGYCKEILWVDGNYVNYPSLPVRDPSIIEKKNPDYIVIAVLSELVADGIRKKLIEKGIQPDKIVWSVGE